MFLSLTSLFNAHLLPRALSTSPETLLTTAALVVYPDTCSREPLPPPPGPENLDPVAMDRAEGRTSLGSSYDIGLTRYSKLFQSVFLAAALATLSVSIRPTMLVFWAYYHLTSAWSVQRERGVRAFACFNVMAVLGG